MTKTKIGVLGAGTWGTALARMLAGNGCDVTMWSALPDELKAMSVTHAHPNLPGNDYEFDSNPGTGEGTSLRV